MKNGSLIQPTFKAIYIAARSVIEMISPGCIHPKAVTITPEQKVGQVNSAAYGTTHGFLRELRFGSILVLFDGFFPSLLLFYCVSVLTEVS
ncbi:hypothetical protein Mapa_011259 [Marchantia paleacea]|nr:hypothetical protein Mapa_011259 [Marchantia paleacea]